MRKIKSFFGEFCSSLVELERIRGQREKFGLTCMEPGDERWRGGLCQVLVEDQGGLASSRLHSHSHRLTSLYGHTVTFQCQEKCTSMRMQLVPITSVQEIGLLPGSYGEKGPFPYLVAVRKAFQELCDQGLMNVCCVELHTYCTRRVEA